jgi:hypothetical protein
VYELLLLLLVLLLLLRVRLVSHRRMEKQWRLNGCMRTCRCVCALEC